MGLNTSERGCVRVRAFVRFAASYVQCDKMC
jgi:hypothetical protein